MTGSGSSPVPAHGGRPPSRRGQKKEAEILAAAARIFNEKGYAASSIRDIADAVGLLKGSLYYYVRSKEDLLYKIIVAVHTGAMANLRQAAATEGSSLDRLLALIRGHIRNFGENIVMIRVFYVDFTHLSGTRHAGILGERDRYEHFLTDLIAAGQTEGVFAADLNPRVAAIAILTMLNSVYVWYRPGGPLTMADIGVEFERLIVRGLSPVTVGDRLALGEGVGPTLLGAVAAGAGPGRTTSSRAGKGAAGVGTGTGTGTGRGRGTGKPATGTGAGTGKGAAGTGKPATGRGTGKGAAGTGKAAVGPAKGKPATGTVKAAAGPSKSKPTAGTDAKAAPASGKTGAASRKTPAAAKSATLATTGDTRLGRH